MRQAKAGNDMAVHVTEAEAMQEIVSVIQAGDRISALNARLASPLYHFG
jgi:hypothetical protein